MRISKEFSWGMAHHLPGHNGLCKNVHGHTYKLKIVVEGDLISMGSSQGMVRDFKDLSTIVKEKIVEKFDHAFVADSTNAWSKDIGDMLEKIGNKVTWLPFRSTAENMAAWIFRQLYTIMSIDEVHLWETETSCAIYTIHDYMNAGEVI